MYRSRNLPRGYKRPALPHSAGLTQEFRDKRSEVALTFR
jgi:hypothetical protein